MVLAKVDMSVVMIRHKYELRRLGKTYSAQRGDAKMLVSFFHATTIGLLSMQPPNAMPAHVMFVGATIEAKTSNGAAAVSGMARLYCTVLFGSVYVTIF